MTKVTLRRDGKRPLQFQGESIANDSTKTLNSTRWTKADVFKTKGGKYVVGIGHITCWEGESEHYSAESFETLEQVADYLEEQVPDLAPDITKALNVAETVD